MQHHRQPALYYLSSQEDTAGPHLICDWNGAPASFRELETDIISYLTAHRITAKSLAQLSKSTAELPPKEAFESIQPRPITCSRSLLTQNDGSQFDFLTLPPIPIGLLKRLLRRSKVVENNSSAITEEEESTSSSSSTIATNGYSCRRSTAQPPVKRKAKSKQQQQQHSNCMSKKQLARMAAQSQLSNGKN